MKKIGIIICMMMLLCFTGCGDKQKVLDLEKVKLDVNNLTEDAFDVTMISNKVEDPSKKAIYKELVDVYEFDLKGYGMTSDFIEYLQFRKSESTFEQYLVIKPKADKVEEVKKEVKNYFSTLMAKTEQDTSMVENRLETTYEGYLIYIVSSDNTEILKRIKSAKTPIFGMLTEITDDELESVIGVKKDQLEEYAIGLPVITQSSSYFVLKPKKDEKDNVKKAIDSYMEKQEKQWETYLPDQYELVKNRSFIEYGDYLIYVISSDNEKVISTIKNATVK